MTKLMPRLDLTSRFERIRLAMHRHSFRMLAVRDRRLQQRRARKRAATKDRRKEEDR